MATRVGRRSSQPRPERGPARSLGPSRPLAIALIAVFIIKLVVLLQLNAHPLLQPEGGLDSAYYLALARRVVAGDLLLGPGLYFVSPLYIYFLAATFWIGGGSLFFIKLVQIALGTAACGLVFQTARVWFGDRAAWIALALAALVGEFTFYEVTILQAALDPFLTAADLYLLSRATREGAPRWSVAAGIALGAHALNRPNVLIVAVGLVLLFAIPRLRSWRSIRSIALAAGIAIALIPIGIRNFAAAGTFAPTPSHGGLNFYIGNNPEADGTYHMVEGITPAIAGQAEDSKRVAERALGRTLTDAEVSSYFTRRAAEWLASQPRAAAGLFVRKIAYTLNATPVALNYSFRFYQDDQATLLRVLRIGPLVLVPAGVLGMFVFVLRRERGPDGFWRFVAFIPLYAIAVAVFFVASRYRVPLLVALAVTGSGTLDTTWAALSLRNWRRVATIAAAAVPLVTLASWNVHLDDGRREERTQMALALIEQEHLSDASRWIALAERDHRDPALFHVRLAQAYRERRHFPEAITQYEAALRTHVHAAQIQLALGQTLLDADRPAEAIHPLSAAAAAGGDRKDVAAYDLARAYLAIGDRARASTTLEQIAADPRRDADGSLELARLALSLDRPATAERHLRAAISRDANRPEPFEQLGFVLMQEGRLKEAIDALQRAVAIVPESAPVRLNLAVAYAEDRRYDEADSEARAALAIDPSYQRAKALLEQLGRHRGER